jgi:hypothetical protein
MGTGRSKVALNPTHDDKAVMNGAPAEDTSAIGQHVFNETAVRGRTTDK